MVRVRVRVRVRDWVTDRVVRDGVRVRVRVSLCYDMGLEYDNPLSVWLALGLG